MRETKTKQIGANTYNVTQLGALEGRKVFLRLAKTLSGGATDATNPIAGIADKLSEVDFEFFCDKFADSTTVQLGDKAPRLSSIFDAHFEGKYLEMAQWLAFAAEVNFADFLGLMQGKKEASPAVILTAP